MNTKEKIAFMKFSHTLHTLGKQLDYEHAAALRNAEEDFIETIEEIRIKEIEEWREHKQAIEGQIKEKRIANTLAKIEGQNG